MKLSKIKISNFRNFRNEEINFNSRTIIIGQNDVGKTNLLTAIRIILDKSFSYLDLEPKESDFNIFSEDEKITITLEISNIDQFENAFIYSYLGKYIHDGNLFIKYEGYKNKEENFKFFIGGVDDNVNYKEIKGRNEYINFVNCVYLDSTRQLKQFLKTSKTKMINSYKTRRESEEISSDEILIENIDKKVLSLNKSVEKISYINKSANFIENELKEMSVHNDMYSIKLSSFNDVDEIINNVDLNAEVNGKKLAIGGDGRSNQIYISMWIKDMNEKFDDTKQFVIFLLEEPESHLHFSLQSMTIRNILSKLNNQFIVTTHSPQIVMEFNPFSIVKLYFDKFMKVRVANNGCNEEIADSIIEFGYRYNLITGSMFFSSAVVLVEGPSEEMLYKYLINKLGKNLEKYNIKIIAVNGIGFEPYVKLLKQLEIPFSIRTDNDVVINSKMYYYSGIIRLIKIYNLFNAEKIDDSIFRRRLSKKLTPLEKSKMKETLKKLEEIGLFLADEDLENDLSKTKIYKKEFSEEYSSKKEFVNYLVKNKAINMFELLEKYKDIDIIENDCEKLIKPITYLLELFDEKN